MTDLTLYGIANCDTVRRARRELAAAGVAHRFHDFRKDGLDPAALDRWIAAVGWETLLNRRGTTWRRISPDRREPLDAERARRLMLEEPTLIRRPVLERPNEIHVGWSEDHPALR